MCTGGSYDYCIVGAGPGGLQLGHLMHEAKRNYIIFEKAPSAGSFFEAFPVHRKLISLNKRFTGCVVLNADVDADARSYDSFAHAYTCARARHAPSCTGCGCCVRACWCLLITRSVQPMATIPYHTIPCRTSLKAPGFC